MTHEELLDAAIAALDCSDDERTGLIEILDVEGFGGRENDATDSASATAVAEERLEWLRQQHAEGLR